MKRKGLLILFSILLVFVILWTVLAVRIVRYGEKDETCICDVAIVLGAGTTQGEVSPVYRERINHGIWLYENGYVKYLIFTGGFGKNNTVSDAYAAKNYAISQGVPESAIFIEELSTITEENMAQSKIIMDRNGFTTALIVSDPLHMKRAMLMAGDYGITGYSSPTTTSMYRTAKTKIPFLVREEFMYIGYCFVRLFR